MGRRRDCTGCTGKVPHKTRAEAEAAAERGAKTWRNINGETEWLHVYLCPHCHQFHVGRRYDK
jgi:hypothetical protein